MTGDRGKLDRAAGLMTGSPQEQQPVPPRPNRLSRSSRRTEADSPRSQPADFRTPTRTVRPRPAATFSAESPHNDSDCQQDIIWDATSPSPRRHGKRGKKPGAGVVDISEIVSRIAPKHGRPTVAEPTLQQWIGDSAAIPCTPDVQGPKPRKKSPRPNGVDDLLKLAKQFDFNMFRRDEAEVEDMQQQSLELLSEDILDFENGVQVSPSPPGNRRRAASPAEQLHPEDDLDVLFDGPTQQVSGNLSQASAAQPAPTLTSGEGSGKPPTSSRVPPASDEFEDDWENDDLLIDSLVLEMTQNPENFTAPKLCSTQKPARQETSGQRESPAPPTVRLGQSAAPKVEWENVRATLSLQSDPSFSVRTVQMDVRTNGSVPDSWTTGSGERSGGRSSGGRSGSLVKSSDWRNPAGGCNSAATTTQNFSKNPEVTSSRSQAPVISDFLDDDLDAFFSSDPVWDDPADDDLLCEMCDDLENRLWSAPAKPTPLVGQMSDQRAALQSTGGSVQDSAVQWPVPGRPAGDLLAGGSVSSAAEQRPNNSLRSTPSVSGSTVGSTGRRRSEIQSQQLADRERFTFKRPNNNLVSMVTNTARGKCSAAEIELKKQQAMERRRRRRLQVLTPT